MRIEAVLVDYISSGLDFVELFPSFGVALYLTNSGHAMMEEVLLHLSTNWNSLVDVILSSS